MKALLEDPTPAGTAAAAATSATAATAAAAVATAAAAATVEVRFHAPVSFPRLEP